MPEDKKKILRLEAAFTPNLTPTLRFPPCCPTQLFGRRSRHQAAAVTPTRHNELTRHDVTQGVPPHNHHTVLQAGDDDLV